jgi:hypothetical protein
MTTDFGLERQVTGWMVDTIDDIAPSDGFLDRVTVAVASTRQERPQRGRVWPATHRVDRVTATAGTRRASVAVATGTFVVAVLGLAALLGPPMGDRRAALGGGSSTTAPSPYVPAGPDIPDAAAWATCETIKDHVPGLVVRSGDVSVSGAYTVRANDRAAYIAVVRPDPMPLAGASTPMLVVCFLDGDFDRPSLGQHGGIAPRARILVRDGDPERWLGSPDTSAVPPTDRPSVAPPTRRPGGPVQGTPPTVGPVPDDPDAPLPDFIPVTYRDREGIAGYVASRDLELQGSFPWWYQQPPTPVYAEDLWTLVGFMFDGKGFVPLGVDPRSLSGGLMYGPLPASPRP